MRWLWVIIGALLAIAGVVWALQGLNILGGSVMSGSMIWAIIGPIVAVAGVVLIVVSLRRRSAPAA